jgi:hypothetical protein
MKKHFSLSLLLLCASIISSENVRGRSRSFGDLLSNLKGRVTKVRRSVDTLPGERVLHGQISSPKMQYRVLLQMVTNIEEQKKGIEELITSLPMCPAGIKALGTPSTAAYWKMLKIVGETYLQSPDIDKKENRVLGLDVRKKVDSIQKHLIVLEHLNTAHVQQYGKSYQPAFNELLKRDLKAFQDKMNLSLQRAQELQFRKTKKEQRKLSRELLGLLKTAPSTTV